MKTVGYAVRTMEILGGTHSVPYGYRAFRATQPTASGFNQNENCWLRSVFACLFLRRLKLNLLPVVFKIINHILVSPENDPVVVNTLHGCVAAHGRFETPMLDSA